MPAMSTMSYDHCVLILHYLSLRIILECNIQIEQDAYSHKSLENDVPLQFAVDVFLINNLVNTILHVWSQILMTLQNQNNNEKSYSVSDKCILKVQRYCITN